MPSTTLVLQDDSTMSSLTGQTLGRYHLDAPLGQGGMAQVYRATDTKLGRAVAVKVILPHFAAEEQFVDRFLREARLAAGLEHPNVVPVYDFGEHEGAPYLVMPLVEGGTLSRQLRGTPLPLEQTVTWTAQLAAALDAAHAAGVVHRDVKPANVLIGREGRLLLADFGIAKAAAATTHLTRTGMVVGTPVYMAPEVAAGRPATAAADRYSLAVMTYEMLCGKPPFEGENALSILHQHATRPVPPLAARLPHLPEAVDRTLEQALAKEPEARPRSCRALAESLAAHLSTEARAALWAATPVSSPELPADMVPTLELPSTPPLAVTPTPSSAAPTLATPPPASTSRTRWIAALGGGAVVAIVGFLLLRTTLPPATDRDAEADAGVSVATPAPAPVPGPPPVSAPLATPPAEAVSPTPPPVPPEAPPSFESRPDEPALSPPFERGPPPSEAPPNRWPGGPDDFRGGGREPGANTRFDELRSGLRRPTEADFDRMADFAQELERHPGREGEGLATALRSYAEGGKALLRGEEGRAARILQELATSEPFLHLWGPSPILFLARRGHADYADYEVALGFSDPRKTAGASLDRRLRESPDDPALRLGRVLVHQLDGEHEAVVEKGPALAKAFSDPDVAAYTDLVVAHSYSELRREDDAFLWLRRSVEAGGRFRGQVALHGALLARQRRRPEDAQFFFAAACEEGVQAACQALHRGPRFRRQRPGSGPG